MDYSALLDSVRPVFVAECNEHINTLELGLISLEEHPDDSELLNSIFRAVHSLKGSCGMYGLDHIVEFTHDFESVMDRVRNFEIKISETLSDLLVHSFDHLKVLIEGIETGCNEYDTAQQKTLMGELEQWLSGDGTHSEAVTSAAVEGQPIEANPHQNERLIIHFEAESFLCGCKPHAILSEVKESAAVESVTPVLRLPDWEAFNPENCYLELGLTFSSIPDAETLEHIFDFTDVVEGHWETQSDHDSSEESAIETKSIDEDNSTEDINIEAVSEKDASTLASESGQKELSESTTAASSGISSTPSKAREKTKTETKRFIRVEADKLDRLIGLVGELIVDFGGLQALSEKTGSQNDSLHQRVNSAAKTLDDLRESSLNLRLMPIADTFNRFHRVVRDTAKQLEKEVKLVLEGTETELDKTILEKIADPLTHLVRNSIDHGIEQPAQRMESGKPEKGTLVLRASHQEGRVRIEIEDDGKGINPDIIRAKAIEKSVINESDELDEKSILQLIFEPGFSTAEKVTDISGRGVGMDVVRRNIQDIGGEILLDSKPGKGTHVDIRLPLTMAILPGFRVKICTQDFIVPLTQLDECINAHQLFDAKQIKDDTLWLRGEILPVLDLRPLLFGAQSQYHKTEAIVVQTTRGRMVLRVDELVGEIQTVVRPLDPIVAQVPFYSGMTQLGTGEIVPILDINGSVEVSRQTFDLKKTGS